MRKRKKDQYIELQQVYQVFINQIAMYVSIDGLSI